MNNHGGGGNGFAGHCDDDGSDDNAADSDDAEDHMTGFHLSNSCAYYSCYDKLARIVELLHEIAGKHDAETSTEKCLGRRPEIITLMKVLHILQEFHMLEA